MFFILSKTLSYLLQPLVIICLGLVVSWIIKNHRLKKIFFAFSTILLIFFSNEFIANEVMRSWEVKVTPFQNLTRKYEYAVLLCGAARTEVGPQDRVYIASAADRINHTLQLYKLGYVNKIMISGGSGRLIDTGEREADELSSLLQLMGVPPEDIIIENNSRNTHESAVEVMKILAPITTSTACILVTSASHMQRAAACFAKVGWPMDTFSTDFLSHYRKFTFDVLFIPKLEALKEWHVIMKEWVGYSAYWVVGYI